MHRTKIVAANWKMNLNLQEGEQLIDQIISGLPSDLSCEVVLAPPFTHLPMLMDSIIGSPVRPAAQHCHFENSGAYTGEVSVEMIKSLGVEYIITGHSERRQLFNETNAIVQSKVDAILKSGLKPIFCCGEPLEIRNSGQQNTYVYSQFEECIFHLATTSLKDLVIAYEPIWAIGTGVTASPEQAQEMHAFIREAISLRYGKEVGDSMRILYGGSIKAGNALQLFSKPDVDGGLVGGASLEATGFIEIIRAACG